MKLSVNAPVVPGSENVQRSLSTKEEGWLRACVKLYGGTFEAPSPKAKAEFDAHCREVAKLVAETAPLEVVINGTDRIAVPVQSFTDGGVGWRYADNETANDGVGLYLTIMLKPKGRFAKLVAEDKAETVDDAALDLADRSIVKARKVLAAKTRKG